MEKNKWTPFIWAEFSSLTMAGAGFGGFIEYIFTEGDSFWAGSVVGALIMGSLSNYWSNIDAERYHNRNK